MKANYLSKRDAAKLLSRLRELSWAKSLEADKPRNVLRIVEEGFTIYRILGFILCEKDETIFPTVHEEYNRGLLDRLPALIVDMGAVPYIARGADVMRPGVTDFRGKFGKGDLLVIRDERNLKPLSISIALENLDRCREMSKGKIAENIHHVNDRIWKFVQSVKHLIERG
ncbi:MAG: hypothetical protein DRN61_02130 [Thaumarchaeota archaeon]|nr:MAG: hypothetical protein DRN61_02130 [Nitrososphaerota archaeon]HDD42304.1 hypothetical protein [Nitrososphaeria archaeon]